MFSNNVLSNKEANMLLSLINQDSNFLYRQIRKPENTFIFLVVYK